MTPQPAAKKINWSIIIPILLFFAGYFINGFFGQLNYNSKVDLLTEELRTLTTLVDEMNKKIDEGNVDHKDFDHRITVLETRAMEGKK